MCGDVHRKQTVNNNISVGEALRCTIRPWCMAPHLYKYTDTSYDPNVLNKIV